MHLEELGQAQRVHASNTTAALLGGSFEVVHAQAYDDEHVQKYGITNSVFIDKEKPPKTKYTARNLLPRCAARRDGLSGGAGTKIERYVHTRNFPFFLARIR